MSRFSILACALLACLPSAVQAQGQALGRVAAAPGPVPFQQVWVVDGAPGSPKLQEAVDAARSGDVIRLRTDVASGTLRIEGKGITIVGDGAKRQVSGGTFGAPLVLDVRDLPAGETVVLRNLTLRVRLHSVSPWGAYSPSVVLQDNAGTIWLEDCSVLVPESDWFLDNAAWDGIVAIDSQAVVLVRSEVIPKSPGNASGCGGPGLAMLRGVRSEIHAYESSFVGPRGQDALYPWSPSGMDGCRGVELEDASFFAQSCELVGGSGGNSRSFMGFCQAAGDGEVALRLDAGSTARLVGCTLASGQGGAGDPGGVPCGPGLDAPLVSSLGSFEELPGALRSYALLPALATAGASATLSTRGPPGELVLTLRGMEPAAIHLPLHLGSQLVLPPVEILIEGTIPASGELTSTVALPPLPALVPLGSLYQQGFFFDAGGAAVLGSASVVVLLP